MESARDFTYPKFTILRNHKLKDDITYDKIMLHFVQEGETPMSNIGRKSIQEDERSLILKPAETGAVLLIVAVIFATALMFFPVIRVKAASEPMETVPDTPKITYIPARPSAEPTPEPVISSLKLLAYGRELNSDGFTAYVGDKPVTLTVELIPFQSHPPVNWEVSNSESAGLTVSDDRKSCEFTPLKSSGKIELTVSCYGAEMVIPVYVWEK